MCPISGMRYSTTNGTSADIDSWTCEIFNCCYEVGLKVWENNTANHAFKAYDMFSNIGFVFQTEKKLRSITYVLHTTH